MKVLILFVLMLFVFLTTNLFAQDTFPLPITDELPLVILTLLGIVAATITEFVQKQKSAIVSLFLAGGISAVIGAIASFLIGVNLSDLPLFVVQVFTMATAVWAVLFKTAGLSKIIGTSD